MEGLHGRSETVGEARARIERACRGEGGLVLLTGEAGIGKSALAEHLAHLAAAAGCQVVWGRCWEAGGAPAYWPWIQVFRDLGMDQDPFADGDPGEDAQGARFAAFDRAVLTLKQRAQARPLVLVLDDLHAADVSSLPLLLLLAREARRLPILVVGAYRDVQPPEVAALLGKIEREGEVAALPRLNAGDTAGWVRQAWVAATNEEAAAVHALTEGHPLFVAEVLRGGRQRMTRTRLLDSLRAVLDEHLARLSAETRATLEVASVLGREFSAAEVAAAGALPLDQVHQRLADAAATRIVEAGDERLFFAHVLMRDRIYEELAPSRKAALHWRAGEASLARGDDPATAAHHLFEGRAAGDPARTGEVALAAATAAQSRFAFEEATHLCRRALQLAGRPPRLTCELRLTLAEALMRAGQSAEGKRSCEQASQLAREMGAAELLARAALVYGSTLFAGFGDDHLVALLREALELLPPGNSAIRARLMARLAAALNPPRGPDVPEIIALARAATAMARALHDDHTLLSVLQSVVSALVYLVDDQERFALLEEIIRLGRTLDRRMAVVNSGAGTSALS